LSETDVSFHRYAALPGIEVLRADDCWRHWRWYHAAYAVCTPLRFEGRAEYVYRGQLQIAGRPHQAIMEPGEVHVTRKLTSPATFRVLFIARDLLERSAESLGRPKSVPHFAAAPFVHARLRQLFTRLHGCLESSLTTALERQSLLAECLEELLMLTEGAAPASTPVPSRASLERAREYLHARAVEPVSLDDLAAVAGLSRFHVAREFARAMGVPPHAYQLLLRVETARDLLSAGASIDEAAKRSGFVDGSHLGRHFKRVTSLTPGAYLRTTARAPGAGHKDVARAKMENAIPCD
jgi:AraC-like DNA-binding protein